MKVFLSSTFIDLEEYRQAVAQALYGLQAPVERMEVFGARAEDATTASLGEVENCDIFVGIYAHRYGYIPKGMTVSVTEQEYDHAKKLNKPRFCFIIDEGQPWSPKMIEDEPGKSKLREFKQRVKAEVVTDTFTTSDDLVPKVMTTVTRYITKEQAKKTPETDSGDIVRIETLQQLQTYYNVDDPNRLIGIRESTLHEIRNWISNWNRKYQKIVTTIDGDTRQSRAILSGSSSEARKPILLITGDPGTGKSWLAYRVVSELFDQGYNISIVNGVNNLRKQLFVRRNNPSDNIGTKAPLEQQLFILDNKTTNIGVVSTPVTLQDIYEIVKGIMPSGLDQDLAGPLIISIREENWNYIVNGAKSGIRLDQSILRELVKKVPLQNLEHRESEKIVESFYSIIEGKSNPPYSELEVNEEVKRKIIEKSKGIPIITKLFFDQINAAIKSGRKTTNKVTLEDVEEIPTSTKIYALKQVFNYYLPKIEDKDEVSNVLSFLYFIAKNGSISVGLLDYLREELEPFLPYYIKEYLFSPESEQVLPLFNIDSNGIMLPFHNDVNEAIIGLVEKPEVLRAAVESEDPLGYEDISYKIRIVNDVDLDIDIRKKAEETFTSQYKTFVMKSMDYSLEKKLYYEIERLGRISSKSAYNLLSIFIEFLGANTEAEYSWEDERKYSERLMNILQNNTIHYSNLEVTIHGQLYWIFSKLEWFYYSSQQLKSYYLQLLSSNNTDVRAKTWDRVSYVLRRGVLKPEEIATLKGQLFELLTSSDEKLRSQSWKGWSIDNLIINDIVQREEIVKLKDRFFELLQSKEEDARARAWQSVSYYGGLVRSNIITQKDYHIFLNLLGALDENVRAQAWLSITSLITSKILKREEILPLKDKFLDLLQSTDDYTKYYLWGPSVFELLRNKILKVEEGLDFYDKAIKVGPNNADLWSDKAVALDTIKRYDDALICYNRALELDPNNAHAWNGKGIVLRNLKRYDEALKHFDKALELDPNYANPWYNRASFKAVRGDTENALADLKKAIEIDKSNIEFAKQNRDFESIRDDERFKALIV